MAFAGGLYTAGALATVIFAAVNLWNPVGWVSASFIVVELACGAYGISNS